MKKLNFYFIVVLITLVMFGCKKDEATTTTKDKLTGKWVITAMTVSPAILGVTDMFSTFDACEKDDLTIFNADGTITMDEGVLKCDPSSPQSYNDGAWTLSTDNKTLTITSTGSDPEIFTIVSLTSTSLVGSSAKVDGGVSYTMTVTMAKK
jgi:hypothetical protein